MDLAQYFGAPVYAAGEGKVIFSGYDRSGFGDHVIIDHGGGLTTIYGHMGARGADYPNC
jgi:murein DD-endopeptidase MepM/ murein hydrolase activator NlpD